MRNGGIGNHLQTRLLISKLSVILGNMAKLHNNVKIIPKIPMLIYRVLFSEDDCMDVRKMFGYLEN